MLEMGHPGGLGIYDRDHVIAAFTVQVHPVTFVVCQPSSRSLSLYCQALYSLLVNAGKHAPKIHEKQMLEIAVEFQTRL